MKVTPRGSFTISGGQQVDIKSMVHQLNAKPTLPELQHLRVQISTAPVEWIEKFLVAGGGKALSGLLQRLLGKKKGDPFIEEVVKCLRYLSNSTVGLKLLLEG